MFDVVHTRELHGHTAPVYGLSYDSAVFATCSRDSTVRVWSRHNGAELRVLSVPNEESTTDIKVVHVHRTKIGLEALCGDSSGALTRFTLRHPEREEDSAS